ncbi:hydroxyacid dehydrogenase [Agromyces sp. MMS24-K17]|uniref:hydroxyacid dehydrogenase n=1 Tax=Agromyces sp. MMS24-K17 TaxID=3372850 RepID=UPI0037540A6E
MSPEHRPAALIAMWPESFDQQFDDTRMARLDALVDLLVPGPVVDLADPAVAPRLAEVEVLVTGWGAPRLTPELLAAMPALRAVFHAAGTVRGIATDAFWARGITITSAADANAVPVAEFTFASIVLANKRAQYLAARPREHRDDWRNRLHTDGYSNLGRTIGVVGFSRIGRRVVALLRQLEDVRILVADPYVDPAEVIAAGAEPVALAELLPQVDVLSLHAPELDATRGMIGAAELAALPDGATVVNTARGSLLETRALERECASGRLHAVLDVTEPEPLPDDSPLYDLPNVTITPHIAGSLGSETTRLADHALDELARWTMGLPLEAEVVLADLGVSA